MTEFKRLGLKSIFADIVNGDYHASSQLENGEVPLVSCKTEKTPEHGIEGYFDIPLEKTYKNVVTITCDGDQPSTAFFHPYTIAVKDNVMVCIPKKGVKITTLLYAISCLNMERWRFSYGRKCYMNKLNTLTVPFPVDKDGNIDQDKIEEILELEKFHAVPKKTLAALKKRYSDKFIEILENRK